MNAYHDPELDDVLQDDELRRLASLLEAARMPEPPLDDAFRTALRRRVMQQAWAMSDGRDSWWRRLVAPTGMAWAGAAAGVVLIASVVVFNALQGPGGFEQIVVQSRYDGSSGVALAQPILVSFNQPMNHTTTEAAVQISPATTVTFAWRGNTLAVQPASGNLAPNTQYQVTIGPGATTAAGQPLTAARTITFVTQAPPTPSPATPPAPTPTSSSLLTAEHQLASIGTAETAPVRWSADSTTVYYVDGAGALRSIAVKGGASSVTLAPDGVSALALSPDGSRLAYIRAGKIEVVSTGASGDAAPSEISPTPAPTALGWSKSALVWGSPAGLFTQGSSGAVQLAPLPATGSVSVVSISPDAAHAAYTQDQALYVIDVATGKSAQLGPAGATFSTWSPDGAELLYATGSSLVVSDMQGVTQGTLPGGDASWSASGAILLGSDTDLYQLHVDGAGAMKIANGTYRAPAWAPDGASFVYFRNSTMYVATAPALPAEPTALDQASAAVASFMQARLAGQPDQAARYLDASGKQAYGSGALSLEPSGEPHFTRYYVLTQELTGIAPDQARFVVRLVLTRGKKDVGVIEETLVLVRDAATRQFLIDQAAAAPARVLGRGPAVVGVVLTSTSVQVTFDSDLDPASISPGVAILDAKGNALGATSTYAGHTVTLTGLQLQPGAQYRLVVLSTLRDVEGSGAAAQYDLSIVGPVSAAGQGGGQSGNASGSPSPSPSPSTSPAASPSPSGTPAG